MKERKEGKDKREGLKMTRRIKEKIKKKTDARKSEQTETRKEEKKTG